MKSFGHYLLGILFFGCSASAIYGYIDTGEARALVLAGVLFGAALAAIAHSLKD